jgi:hypothetical protein
VLRHPDQESTWVVVAAADVPRMPPPQVLTDRLAALCARLPVVGARLVGGHWQAGTPPVPADAAEPLADPRLFCRFDLAADSPVRVLAGAGQIAVAVHHAALDGRSAVAVLAALLGAAPPAPGTDPPAGPSAGRWPLLRRITRPADVVAAVPPGPAAEMLLSADIRLGGRDVTARLAAACVAAAGEHNRRLGRRWRRVGLSLGVGGPPGAGNLATYRRLDLRADGPVAAAARAALASPVVPAELASGWRPPRFTALAARASDSLLVSNVGRFAVPEATRLVFAPVARGRSAVAFGTAGLVPAEPDGPVRSTLTLRTRHLSQPDAQRLLADVLDRLS